MVRCLFLGLLFVKENFLTDVSNLTGFENEKPQINCFFHDRSPPAKVKFESFSIKDFDLRKKIAKLFNILDLCLQKFCLIWVSISVVRFLVRIKSPRLKLVRILLKLKTGTKVKNYTWFQKISILVSPLKCIDKTFPKYVPVFEAIV